jgi:hypothetical protein
VPFDGANTEAQPKLVEVVPRLVAKLAPLVNEIATRSRSEGELVLRCALEDGRREEIFMPKARLREKIAPLDAEHTALFDAFMRALDAAPPPSDPAVAAEPEIDVVVEARAEVPASKPPVRRSSGTMAAVVVPVDAKPEPPKEDTSDDPVVEVVTEEVKADARPPARLTLEEEAEADDDAPPPSSRTSTLVATLKHIRGLGSEGHLEEVFRQYAVLFASSAFAACRPDDQRQALKLMIFGRTAPTTGEWVTAAFRAALPILQVLVVKEHDPADYEMLGMTYVALDEPDKAREIFKKALELERARNAASDLCGTLMRRVSQL